MKCALKPDASRLELEWKWGLATSSIFSSSAFLSRTRFWHNSIYKRYNGTPCRARSHKFSSELYWCVGERRRLQARQVEPASSFRGKRSKTPQRKKQRPTRVLHLLNLLNLLNMERGRLAPIQHVARRCPVTGLEWSIGANSRLSPDTETH